MEYRELADKAIKATQKSIATYSNFKVGAALLTDAGKVYIGANIENATFGLTICAERSALITALLNDERKFKAIAIVSGDGNFCPPCGSCRQLLFEFCGPELDVILLKPDKELFVKKLKDLLPITFDESFLG